MRRRFRRLCWAGFLLPLLLAGFATAASADHLAELILFDQTGAEKKLDEGLVRRYLGLLNADGKPALPLVPLVSADGTRAAYDMTGAATNPTFDNRLLELRADAGTLMLMTHGGLGTITMERQIVKGFGAGTGATDQCAGDALPVTRRLTNVTVRMVVCLAARSSSTVTSVAQSLRSAIEAAGGSVSALTASTDPVEVRVRKQVRLRDGAQPTAAEVQAVVTAVDAFTTNTRAFKDQYKDYQAVIDAAAPPDLFGSKIIGKLVYEANVDTFSLPKAQSTNPDPLIRALEDLDVVITDGECLTGCGPVAVQGATWGGMKNRYR